MLQTSRFLPVVSAALATGALIFATTPTTSAGDVRTAAVAAHRRQATMLGSLDGSWSERFRVRPDILSLSGDGTAFLGGSGWRARGHRILSFGRIAWTEFGGPSAVGSGLLWLNDCLPDCAGGRFLHFPAQIRAGAVRGGHYTKLSVRTVEKGHTATDAYLLRGAGSNASWTLVTVTRPERA